MSEDWDTVTRIGQSRSRGGGGGGPRPSTLKSRGALNAALRTGGVTAEKKQYGSANSKSDPEGQFLAKVANSDGIVKPKKKEIDKNTGDIMLKAREQKGFPTQADLARRSNVDVKSIQKFEARIEMPNQQELGRIEKQLGISLRGETFGQPKAFGKKKKGKGVADKKDKEEKKGKEEKKDENEKKDEEEKEDEEEQKDEEEE